MLKTSCRLSVTVFLFCAVFSTAVAQNACQTKRMNAVKAGQQKIRGANLGSWFVLESELSPKPWDEHGCDKATHKSSYLLEKCLGSKAKEVMEHHWSTFVTEQDFIEMSKHGVNVVRLPVGWWQVSLINFIFIL